MGFKTALALAISHLLLAYILYDVQLSIQGIGDNIMFLNQFQIYLFILVF